MSITDTPQNDERWARQRREWAEKATLLNQKYTESKNGREDAEKAVAKNPEDASLKAAAGIAGKSHLQAAKALNEFVLTGARTEKLAAAIGERLRTATHLDTWTRHMLEDDRDKLIRASQEFGEFKTQSKLVLVNAKEVRADGKIYDLDLPERWDTATRAGFLGSTWDKVKHNAPEIVRAATLSPADQRTACEGVINQLTGALAGKVLPAHAQWGARDAAVWEQIAGKGFPEGPAKDICKLIYPSDDVPEYFRRHGRAAELPELGRVTAVDVDVHALAAAGLSENLSIAVSEGRLEEAQARELLRETVGENIALAPVPQQQPTYAYQVAATLPLELDARVWSDAGPMSGVPWVPEPSTTMQPTPTPATASDLSPQMPTPRPDTPNPSPAETDVAEVQRLDRLAREDHASRQPPPTPGGMSFAEADRRRDAPEDTPASSLQPVGRPNVPDPLHDLQLLRDVQIANARTVAELGPKPLYEPPPEPKRKPNLHWAQEHEQEPSREREPERMAQAALLPERGMHPEQAQAQTAALTPERSAPAPQGMPMPQSVEDAAAAALHRVSPSSPSPAPSTPATAEASNAPSPQALIEQMQRQIEALNALVARQGRERGEQGQREHEQMAKDPREPGHRDHAMCQGLREQFQELYAKHGIPITEQQLDRTTAGLMIDTRASRMTEVTFVCFGQHRDSGQINPDRIIMFQGDPKNPASPFAWGIPSQAQATPIEQSYQQFEQATQKMDQQNREMEQQRQQWAQNQRQGNTFL